MHDVDVVGASNRSCFPRSQIFLWLALEDHKDRLAVLPILLELYICTSRARDESNGN